MKTVNILLADDHAVVREGLKALIEARPGFHVVGEAATGREAVALARQLRPHIVVLDFGMPELNGLEATLQLRALLPETEILVLTMHESERLAQRLLGAGARGYLLKSDAKAHLMNALHTLSKHEPYLTPKAAALVYQGYLTGGSSGPDPGVPSDRLTRREREVLQLVAEGKTTKEIAVQLGLSVKTVEVHRTHLMNKLDAHSVAELVRYAIRNQIIEP